MGLFDGFDLKNALPNLSTSMPDINLQSFMPNLSTGGDVFSVFDNMSSGASSFFSGMPSYKSGFQNSFSSAFGGSFNSFLPDWRNSSKTTPNFTMPWDTPSTGGGGLGTATGASSSLNQYASAFISAGARFGIDPNVLMGIAMVENGSMGVGDQYSGAQGIMQIMPGGYPEGEKMFPNWRTDPSQNILLGAYILSQKIKEFGSVDNGIMGYLGYGGPDAYGTTAQDYLARVKQAMSSLTYGGYTGQVGAGFTSMFNGQQFGISSENGVSNGMNPGWYKYAEGLGLQAGTHPGIDVTTPEGTTLRMPKGLTGVVEVADGTYYGYDPSGTGASSSPQTGQLRIRLSNGDILIFGHMKNIYVYVGQTLNAGSILGLTGTAGSGAHVHMEYRLHGQNTSTGYRSVDPRQYIG